MFNERCEMSRVSDLASTQAIESAGWDRCADRLPTVGSRYYLLLGCEDNIITFYSKGVAWEGPVETRVARLVKALDAARYYRNKGMPCLILECIDDLHTWYSEWRCHALVLREVWDDFNDC